MNPYSFGQNFKNTTTGKEEYLHWIYNDADPIIKKRFLRYTDQVSKKEILLTEFADTRLAAHSEIRALDEAIKVRRDLGLPVSEDTINELYVYNNTEL